MFSEFPVKKEELQKTIEDLQDILARPERVVKIIDEQMEDVKSKFGIPRKTEIKEVESAIYKLFLRYLMNGKIRALNMSAKCSNVHACGMIVGG